MILRFRASDAGRLGFSLIETLAALFLSGLIMAALARLTSQWMPGWDRGFERIQRSQSVGIALERISADLGSAEFLRASRDTKQIFFEGSEEAVTLVRTAIGPNIGPGLEVIRIVQTGSGNESVLVRSRARFVPGPTQGLVFSDPVELLRSPFRVSFSFAKAERAAWLPAWQESGLLPSAVLITMRNAATGEPIGISRVVPIHIAASAEMTCSQVDHGCGETKEPVAAQPGGRAER